MTPPWNWSLKGVSRHRDRNYRVLAGFGFAMMIYCLLKMLNDEGDYDVQNQIQLQLFPKTISHRHM